MLKVRLRFTVILFLAILSAVSLVSSVVNADSENIEILTVDVTIVPVVANYLDRGISRAESEGDCKWKRYRCSRTARRRFELSHHYPGTRFRWFCSDIVRV